MLDGDSHPSDKRVRTQDGEGFSVHPQENQHKKRNQNPDLRCPGWSCLRRDRAYPPNSTPGTEKEPMGGGGGLITHKLRAGRAPPKRI